MCVEGVILHVPLEVKASEGADIWCGDLATSLSFTSQIFGIPNSVYSVYTCIGGFKERSLDLSLILALTRLLIVRTLG